MRLRCFFLLVRRLLLCFEKYFWHFSLAGVCCAFFSTFSKLKFQIHIPFDCIWPKPNHLHILRRLAWCVDRYGSIVEKSAAICSLQSPNIISKINNFRLMIAGVTFIFGHLKPIQMWIDAWRGRWMDDWRKTPINYIFRLIVLCVWCHLWCSLNNDSFIISQIR